MTMLSNFWHGLGMSEATSAAIIGGAVGSAIAAIALVIIESIKWWRQQNAMKKAAQVERDLAEKATKRGLYCEITHHHFLALDKDKDGSSNYKLIGFQNNFYKDNILDVTRFINEDTIFILASYYSYLELVISWEEKFAKYHSKLEDISECNPKTLELRPIYGKTTEWNELNEKKNAVKDILRRTLAPTKKMRQDLRAKLKGAFKNDPSLISFIDVLPEDQEWWQKLNKDVKS